MTRTLAVSTLLLILVSSAALADDSLLLSPELPLTGDTLRSAAGAQSMPSIAAGSTNFLAAWTDHRPGSDFNADVYASRIDVDGNPLDPANIPVVPTYTEDTHAAVVWNGSRYVVVYASLYSSLGLTAIEYDAEGRQTRGNPLFREQGAQLPAIAWDGDRYLVTWRQVASDGVSAETRGMFVSSLLEPSVPFLISSGIARSFVATDGDGFLVVMSGEGRATARHISSTGERGPEVELGASAGDASVVWTGREYLVVKVSGGVEVTRLTSAGEIVTSKRLNERTTIAESRVAAAWAGDRLVMAWADYASGTPGEPRHEVMLLSVDAELRVGEGPMIAFAGDGLRSQMAIAIRGNVAALVWGEIDGPDYAIESMTFDPRMLASAIGRPRKLVSRSIAIQNVVDAVASGDQWGTLWLENVSDSERRLRFGRVAAGGQSLDGDGIELGLYDGASIAANDSMYVIVAYRLGWLYAMRIAHDGTLLDPEPVRFGPASLQPDVAAAPDGTFLAVWANGANIPQPNYVRYDTFGAVITAGGQVLAAQQLSPPAAANTSYSPSGIVWGGSDYHLLLDRAVTVQCGSRICTSAHSLMVQPVTAGGTVLGGLTLVTDPGSSFGAGNASIASGGPGSVVTWESYGSSTTVHAKRLTSSAALVDQASSDGIVMSGHARESRATFNGRTFLVSWLNEAPAGERPTRTIATLDFATGAIGERVELPDEYFSHFVLSGARNGRTMALHDGVRQLTPEAHAGGIRRATYRILGGLRRRVTSH
jgi:hypothetical protein